MKNRILIAVLCSTLHVSAQPLFTYGNHEVSKQDFLHAFNKNNTSKPTEKAYRDYLELYIRFKLKVQEALDKKMDTLPNQKADFQNFRNQIAEGFMTDESALQMLVQEAFERSKKDRRIALDNKEIGWITVFVLPYKLENLVYRTAVGNLSDTFHLASEVHQIKVLEERPAAGKMKAAQILLLFPPDANDSLKNIFKHRADSIYKALKQGASFEKLAKRYSNDNLTYVLGGEMPEFAVGHYDPIFEKAVFDLKKNGDITRPVLTEMGYHIVKRIALTPVNTNKDSTNAMEALRQQVLNDSRINVAKKAMVEKVYHITGYDPAKMNEYQLLDLYRDSLEKYNPEFAAQMKEFKEGNLLFEIMQTTIWDKPLKDQDQLEEKWIAGLKKKYPVKINEDVFKTL